MKIQTSIPRPVTDIVDEMAGAIALIGKGHEAVQLLRDALSELGKPEQIELLQNLRDRGLISPQVQKAFAPR